MVHYFKLVCEIGSVVSTSRFPSCGIFLQLFKGVLALELVNLVAPILIAQQPVFLDQCQQELRGFLGYCQGSLAREAALEYGQVLQSNLLLFFKGIPGSVEHCPQGALTFRNVHSLAFQEIDILSDLLADFVH